MVVGCIVVVVVVVLDVVDVVAVVSSGHVFTSETPCRARSSSLGHVHVVPSSGSGKE